MEAAIATHRTPEPGPDAQRVASLLELDPQLAERLAPSEREQARGHLPAQVRRLPSGPWEVSSATVVDPGHLGLLVLDGVIAREVLVDAVISTELLGPGDVVRPWELSPDACLLQVETRWQVLSPARVAVLDRRVARGLAAHPALLDAIAERLSRRSHRLAVSQAISNLNRIEPRLRALFRHLAEHWGRPHRDGVVIPLTLSHRVIAQLIGSRRPTVSSTLTDLARAGELVRLDDGSWLLVRTPVAASGGEGREDVRADLRRAVVVRA